ncbi:MAG: nitrogenase molybdenum-iron protein subunit beta [Oscillospiraceae bacterium]|jgi:nitrogenase molybdenum-iron protein beta chain|nr:nitrogenase molybdenum-iron protein subunit beta [Oscillospiraceae bacterium]
MLDMTPVKVAERKALRINPCKTCQPVGAMYCALGVRSCMPHSHGSQGCCSYHRTVLSRHFKEPAIASSSSFTEGASVFGGRSNVSTAVKNVFDIYAPDIIAIHTTCLSETIGDDVKSYIMDMEIPEGKQVVHCNTPSYVGSHINGFSNMMMGFMDYLIDPADGSAAGKTALFPGWVNPGDVREIKRIAGLMGAECICFPDHSGVLDAPMTGKYELYPDGGTTLPEIRALGGCSQLIALGEITSAPPAQLLTKKWHVPEVLLPTPVGVAFTDRYILALRQCTKREVPRALEEQRGQLVDLMLDAHAYTSGKTAAIFGDPDIVIGMTSLCLEMGLVPKYVITGTPREEFGVKVNALFDAYHVTGCRAKANADLFELHQWIKNEPVDLLIGSTYGKQIAKAEDIPFVRVGFPVLDRYGGTLLPVVGYVGGIRMAEKITDALMDRRDRDAADEDLEIVM